MIMWWILALATVAGMIALLRRGLRRKGSSLYAALYLILDQTALSGALVRQIGLLGAIPLLGLIVSFVFPADDRPWSRTEWLEAVKYNRLTMLVGGPVLGVTLCFRHEWLDAGLLFAGAMVALWPLRMWRLNLLLHQKQQAQS